MITLLKDSIIMGSVFAAGIVVDEKLMLPIGTLSAVCGLVWWMGRKLQRIDDQLENIDEKVEDLECVKHRICPKK